MLGQRCLAGLSRRSALVVRTNASISNSRSVIEGIRSQTRTSFSWLDHCGPTASQAVLRLASSFAGSAAQGGVPLAKPIMVDFLADLSSAVPHLEVSTNKYELQEHGRGESHHPSQPADAIIKPTTTTEVSTIVRLCSEHNVSIVPYGVGTSLEGHVASLSTLASISLDMSAMNEIHHNGHDGGMLEDSFVTVGAGVTRKTLNEALRHTGMQFMVDPGADATIGGMTACGASGTTAVRYGTMRENVMALEVVLADGSVARCGSLAAKNSAGYDLMRLLIGSEGTLGVITQVTVKVHPIAEHVVAAVCTFDSLHDAAEAVAAIRMCAIPVERCELLDASSVEAFNRYNGGDRDISASNSTIAQPGSMAVKPTLFLEFAGPTPEAVDAHVQLARDLCLESSNDGESNKDRFVFAADEDERRALWAARHKLYYAAIASRPGAETAFLTDVCVPLSKFADLISETVEDVERLGVVGPCFGHAGDGNFHCILPVREDDTEEYRQRIHEVNDNLIQRTLRVGGTCTGEHGVGYGKIKYLSQQYGVSTVQWMETIKKAMDPQNILNPGKIVPFSHPMR